MKTILLFFSFFLSTMCFGQFSIGASLGAMNYQGDLAKNNVVWSETHFAAQGMLRYEFERQFAARLSILFGSLSGDDANNDYVNRYYRFSSIITEFALMAEWLPLTKDRATNTGIFIPSITPVLGLGIGLDLNNPKTECYQNCFDGLEPIIFPEPGLEKTFVSLAGLVGVKVDIVEAISAGLELGYRLPFTDYLDGVSEYGNSSKNDLYWYLGGNIYIYLNN